MQNVSYQKLFERVRAHHNKSAAASAPSGAPKGDPVTDVKDPTDTGVKAVPTDPAADPKKQQTPASSENGPAAATLETSQLKAEGTGTAEVPATTDGNAKDDAVKNPTDKIAAAAGKLKSAIDALKAKRAGTEAKDPTEKKKVEATPAAPAPTGMPAKKDESKAPAKEEPKSAAVESAPAAAATPAPVAEKAGTVATTPEFEPDVETLAKLARTILSIEGGHDLVTRFVKEAKGREIADDLIAAAINANERITSEEAAAADFFKNASAEDIALMEKCATAHGYVIEQLNQELVAATTEEAKKTVMAKQAAYAGGAQDAAAMMDNGGQLPGAEPEISDDQILAVLQAMVQNGELDPKVLEQIMAQLSGGAAGDAGGDAASAPPADDAAKAASVHLFDTTKLAAAKAPDEVKRAVALLAKPAEKAAA